MEGLGREILMRSQQQEEQSLVGWSLRLGAWLSFALIAIGFILSYVHAGAADWVLRAGFLLLMFTPAVRIMVAGIVFLHEKDYRYALVSLTVLTIVVATSVLAMLNILPQLER
jgi:uncharacterized membrane protein